MVEIHSIERHQCSVIPFPAFFYGMLGNHRKTSFLFQQSCHLKHIRSACHQDDKSSECQTRVGGMLLSLPWQTSFFPSPDVPRKVSMRASCNWSTRIQDPNMSLSL